MRTKFLFLLVFLFSIATLTQDLEAKKKNSRKHKSNSSFIEKNKGRAKPYRVNETYMALYYDERQKSFIQDYYLIEEGEIVYVYPTQYYLEWADGWVMELNRYSKEHRSNWFMPVECLDQIYY